MARSTPINIPLAVGMNNRDDSKLLGTTRLVDITNASFDKGGALQKRNGYTELSAETASATPSTIASTHFIVTREDELLLGDSEKLYSWAAGPGRWVDKGELESCTLTETIVLDSNAAQTISDHATANNVTVYAWEDSRGGVYYAALDATTGATLIAEKQLAANGQLPRVLKIKQNILIIFHETADNDIWVKKLTPTNLLTSDALAIKQLNRTDLATSNFVMDVAWGDPNSTEGAFVAYAGTSNTVKFLWVDDQGLIGGLGAGLPPPASVNGQASPTGISCLYNSSNSKVYITEVAASVFGMTYRNDVTSTGYGSATYSNPALLGAIADRVVIGAKSTGLVSIYEDTHASNNYLNYVTNNGLTKHLHCSIASRFFEYDGKAYVWLMHDSSLQATYFLVDSDFNIVARALPGISNGSPSKSYFPNVQSTATGVFKLAAGFKKKLAVDDTQATVYTQPGIKQVVTDFSATDAYNTVEHNGILYLGGGFLQQYDGEALTEQGFLLYPENVSAAVSTGGSMPTSTAVSYRVYWEWTNAKGQREQSTTASVVSLTASEMSGTSVTLTIPTLSWTKKKGSVEDLSAAIYRTTAGGNTYYRVSSTDPTTASTAANAYRVNVSSDSTMTFLDTMADSTAATKELDYLNSGELDNVACPGLTGLSQAQGRVWAVSPQDKKRVYYSKLTKDGTALEFNETLYVDLPVNCTSVAELNSRVVLFTSERIYLLTGEGPDNLGLGGAYGVPNIMRNDVGLSDPRTLVETPKGWMFKSKKGIYTLAHNYVPVYVGQDVAGYNAQTFTAATLIPDKNHVRFLTSSGRTLVFDYERGIWSNFKGIEGNGATVWQDKYTFCRNDGTVWKEDSSYLDNNTEIAVSCTTSWIRPAEVQGLQRIRSFQVLGNYVSVHKLRVEIGYDDNEDSYQNRLEVDTSDFISSDTWGADSTWGDSNVWGGNKTFAYDFEVKLARQKCKSLRIRLTEIPSTTTAGAGVELNTISLAAIIKQGPHNIHTNRRYQ